MPALHLDRAPPARISRCPDIERLPRDALLSRNQVSALTGFAVVTLRLWAREGGAKGPPEVRVEGYPRYRAGDVREWLARRDPRKPARRAEPAARFDIFA